MRSFWLGLLSGLLVNLPLSAAFAAEPTATLVEVAGDVALKLPKGRDYQPVSRGLAVPDGARVRTGEQGRAKLRFPDGSESELRAATELIVRVTPRSTRAPSGVTVFFGRVWSKVTRAFGGDTTFEVRSANAVAGVRGTEFEVGVAIDGSTRVVVQKGEVAVQGEEDAPTAVKPGELVDSTHLGELEAKQKAPPAVDWAGWFSAKAKEMEARGLKVAKALDGRLNKRKAQVEKLLKEQRRLRGDIERLEVQKSSGADVEGELAAKLDELARVTERLESMRARLEGAFGLFDRWKALSGTGAIGDGKAVAALALDVEKIAQDFADMIEEGTDLSEEGMDELMEDMKDKKPMDRGRSPMDELFE